jgi:hypothetical protein
LLIKAVPNLKIYTVLKFKTQKVEKKCMKIWLKLVIDTLVVVVGMELLQALFNTEFNFSSNRIPGMSV